MRADRVHVMPHGQRQNVQPRRSTILLAQLDVRRDKLVGVFVAQTLGGAEVIGRGSIDVDPDSIQEPFPHDDLDLLRREELSIREHRDRNIRPHRLDIAQDLDR